MMKRSEPDNKKRALPEKILDQFEEKEREMVRQLWHEYGEHEYEAGGISREETERALSRIHRRLDEPVTSHGEQLFTRIVYFKWAAAALIILIAGAGWLSLPRTVTVPYGQMAAIELSDGSTVEMNSGTTIRYSRLFTRTNRTVTLDGEAWFDVSPGKHPFTVEANGSGVEVAGTSFNVRSWSDDPQRETTVTVSSGEVYFYPAADPDRSVTVTPEQMSRWSAGMAEPSLPEPADLDQVLGWREMRLIFDNRPLGTIFRELERRYDVRIEWADPLIEGETLTAFYVEPGSVESILQDICMVKGLRYAETINSFRVYREE